MHWDGKFLHDVTGIDAKKVDRLYRRIPVFVTVLVDGDTQLLGVPKLASRSGKAAADSGFQLLNSWQADHWYVLRYSGNKHWSNESSLHAS